MTFFKPIRCRWKGFSPSRSPFRLLHHFESGTSQCIAARGSAIHCLFRHTGILNLGKQKMGAWTSAFTIGVSNRSCTALSTVKSTLFQSTLILKQTTHNFSKSPSKSLLWLNQRQVVVFVARGGFEPPTPRL